MRSSRNRSVYDAFALVGDWVSRGVGIIDLFGLRNPYAFVRGWGAPVAAVVVFYTVLAHRYRQQPAAVPCLLFIGIAGVALGQVVIRSGAKWQPGLGRWAVAMTVVIVFTLPFASATFQGSLLNGGSVSRTLAGLAVAPVLVVTALVLAANGSAMVVRTVRSAWVTEPQPVTSASAVVAPPEGERALRFPAEHSRCVGPLDSSAPRPDGVGEPMWSRMLLVAADRREWRLCRVAGTGRGPDGLVAIRVFSGIAGPEGYILARPRGDTFETAFIEPQAGQLYYQQPGGTDMASWGIPGEPALCGNGGRLSIFRRADGSISGFSRWSRAIAPETRGTMAAYFTTDAVALPLLHVLEVAGRKIPVASGPVTAAGIDQTQYFGKLRIASSMPPSGVLTAERLLALC